MIKLIDSTS